MTTSTNHQANTPVVTRIAPSPTGYLHIGTVRTALFNYLFARHYGGSFILRIEDTDKARSKSEYEAVITEGLKWVGLDWDAFYRQSERLSIHVSYIDRLLQSGKAYLSKEPKKDAPTEEVEVVRLKNPNKVVTFNDLVRGTVSFDTTELGDFVIARAKDDPLYHLVVVIDDHEMNVTHVIRAEEHLSNTPRQILIHEAIGIPVPQYAHIPLILAPDKSKLSKRKGAVAVTDYRDQGFLPEALLNYLALLGWNPGTDDELFSLQTLCTLFDFSGVQKGGAIFDIEKLNWFNREYIKKMPLQEVRTALAPYLVTPERTSGGDMFRVFEKSDAALQDILERVSTFGEVAQVVKKGEYDFYVDRPEYESALLLTAKSPDATIAIQHLNHLAELLSVLPEGVFMSETVRAAVWDYATEEGRGAVLWPMRIALSGKKTSPDPFVIAEAIGKAETLLRIDNAIKKLQNML